MELNETQLEWIIEKLDGIVKTSTPWNVRDQLKDFKELLQTRIKKEV
jgi:hypothetical protein